MSFAFPPGMRASDSVAIAVESHALFMEAAGYGDLSVDRANGEIVVVFGPVEVRGESYDVALLRLASALLDHPSLCGPFLVRMRDPAMNPPAIHLRDNHLTVRTTAR